MVDDFLDFEDSDLYNKDRLNITLYLNETDYKIPLEESHYVHDNWLGKRGVLHSSLGNSLARILADPKTGEIRGDIYNYKESLKERILDLVFTQPLHYILRYRGFYFLHASAICKDHQIVLITGPQDCGKSTLAITLSQNGFGFLTDDKCFLKISKKGISIIPLPFKVGISDEYLKRHPELKKYIVKKYRFGKKQRFSKIHISKVDNILDVKFKMILFPKYQKSKAISIRPLSKKDALNRLEKEHLDIRDNRILSGTFGRHFIILANLVSQADSFELVYNDDVLDKIASVIKKSGNFGD